MSAGDPRIELSGDERVRAAIAAQVAIGRGKSHHGVVSAVVDAVNRYRTDEPAS